MTKGDELFVRIDYRIEGTEFGPNDFEKHIDYLTQISKERKFFGGGFANTKGGMITFEASSLEEAKKICDNDPLILKGLFKYELFKWKIAIVSEDI